MGLDMYLYKDYYLGGMYAENKNDVLEINVERGFMPKHLKLKVGDLSSIITLAAKWRKAYAINDWFMQKCDANNCHRAYVDTADLMELFDIVCQVRADHDKARELLPSAYGEYDDWYFDDLDYTYKALKPLVEEIKSGKDEYDLYYEASW